MANCNGVKACARCGRQVGCSCQLHYNATLGQCVCCACDPTYPGCKRQEATSSDVQNMLDKLKAPQVTITSATARITHETP